MTTAALLRCFTLAHESYGDRFPLESDEQAITKAGNWTGLLADVSDSDGMTAFEAHCRSSQYPPTPAEIHAMAARMSAERAERMSEAQRTLEDRFTYGSSRDSWVYCVRCQQAITLDERCDSAVYEDHLGWHHLTCPQRGTRPLKANQPEEEPKRYKGRQRTWHDEV